MSPKYIALLCAGVVLALLLVALKLYGAAQYDKGYQAAQIEQKDERLTQITEAAEKMATSQNEYEKILEGLYGQAGVENLPPPIGATIDRLPKPKPAK